MSVSTAIRQPLANTTNSPPPSPPSGVTKESTPSLRRKSTRNDLHENLDSSESRPSTGGSIYEASLQSEIDRDTWPSAAQDTFDLNLPGPSSWENQVYDSEGNIVPASFLRPISSDRKHTPHLLDPITEKSSYATLQPSTSLDDRTSISTLRPRSPGLRGRHKKSYSLSDLPPTPEPPSPPSPPPSTPLPQLNNPSQPPPTRSPTPPGLPTFGGPEAVGYRLSPPSPKKGFRNAFRSVDPAQAEYRKQTAGLPKGVVMRGEDGTLVRGKFDPPRSGHTPPQARHHDLLHTPEHAEGSNSRLSLDDFNARRERARLRSAAVDRDRAMAQALKTGIYADLAEKAELKKQRKREMCQRRKESCLKILRCSCHPANDTESRPWHVYYYCCGTKDEEHDAVPPRPTVVSTFYSLPNQQGNLTPMVETPGRYR